MTTNTADLHKAVSALWDSEGLDAKFTDLWSAGLTDDFLPLNDQEAGPDQPWPYCVYEFLTTGVYPRVRMSADDSTKREVREIPLEFKCHANVIEGDSRSAKEIANYLAEEIMKVFGGHPTVSPTALTLDNGQFLITQLTNDYGVRTGDNEYLWVVSYNLVVDVPVAV